MREILLDESWVSWMEGYKGKERPISVFIGGKEYPVEQIISSSLHPDFLEFEVYIEGDIKLRIISGEKDSVLYPVPVIYAKKVEPSIENFEKFSFPLFPDGRVLFSYSEIEFKVSVEEKVDWMVFGFWPEVEPFLRKIEIGRIYDWGTQPLQEKDVRFSFQEGKMFSSLCIPLEEFPLPPEILTLRINFQYNGKYLLSDFVRKIPFAYALLYFL